MSAFSSIDLFRELDPRRRRQAERDLGIGWRHRDNVFRLSWVDTTGELIAVRISPRLDGPRGIKIATHLPAAEVIDDRRYEVIVLAQLDRHEVKELLTGYAPMISQNDSLGWVLDRLAQLTALRAWSASA